MVRSYMAALITLNLAAVERTDIASFLQKTVIIVGQALDAPYTAIWDYMPDQSFVFRTCNGWADEVVTSAALAHMSIAGIALHQPSAIYINWLSDEWNIEPYWFRNHRVSNSIFMGIANEQQQWGVLSIDCVEQRTFTAEAMDFVKAVATLVTLVFTQAAHLQACEQDVEKRVLHITEQFRRDVQEKAILEERQRLARDLHDSITQALYGVTLHARVVQTLLDTDEKSAATESLCALQSIAQEALDEMRLLIFELRPPILEQVGLEMALQARLNTVEGRANLRTKLIIRNLGQLPEAIEQALYRIAQEALNNSLKYAHAQHIVVQLHQTQTHVTLEIRDDGIGFDTTTIHNHGGLGLQGMAERVTQLRGTLTVESTPTLGTTVIVEIAL